jgi:acyl-CoA thioesterase-1
LKNIAIIAAIMVAGVLALAVALPSVERLAQNPRPVLPRDSCREIVYVALGDSTAVGVGASGPEHNYVSRLTARLQAIYRQVHTTNLGVSGATAADVAAGQLARAVALQPDLVTLSIEPNDITQGRDVQHYERTLDIILGTLTRETRAVVVVNLLPDLAVAPRISGPLQETVGQQTVRFNAVLQRVAQKHDVEVVDLYTPSRNEIPQHPERVAADDYHPSDAGYAR